MDLSEMNKTFLKNLKTAGKPRGFKGADYCIYRIAGELFFSAYILSLKPHENEYTVMLNLNVKKYSYDDILWAAMNDNDKSALTDRLRAIGAFVVPSVLFHRYFFTYNADKDITSVAAEVIDGIYEIQNSFAGEVCDFNSFVLSSDEKQYGDVLRRIIAYIDMLCYDEAINLARVEISKGDTGMLKAGKKGCYEYLIEYCKRMKKEKYLKKLKGIFGKK